MAPTELFNRHSQRSVPWVLLLTAVVLLAARFTYSAKEEKHDLVRWVAPDVAISRARATGKPIMYDFTAEWCRPCHMLDAAVFQDADAAAGINEKFIPVRITDRKQEDGSNSPVVDALEKKYSVRAFPTVIFANADGTELGRMEGFKSRAELERIADRVTEERVR